MGIDALHCEYVDKLLIWVGWVDLGVLIICLMLANNQGWKGVENYQNHTMWQHSHTFKCITQCNGTTDFMNWNVLFHLFFFQVCLISLLYSFIIFSCGELADCVTYDKAEQMTPLTCELSRKTWKYDTAVQTEGTCICQHSVELSVCQSWPKEQHLLFRCATVNHLDIQKN